MPAAAACYEGVVSLQTGLLPTGGESRAINQVLRPTSRRPKPQGNEPKGNASLLLTFPLSAQPTLAYVHACAYCLCISAWLICMMFDMLLRWGVLLWFAYVLSFALFALLALASLFADSAFLEIQEKFF